MKMVTRVPTNDEQDELDLIRRCKDFQLLYDGRKRLARRLRKYEEYRRGMLGEVSVITKYWNNDFPPNVADENSWVFKVYIWNQRDPEIVDLNLAKVRY